MKRSKKTFNDQQVSTDRESGAVLKNSELKWGPNPMTLVGFIVVLLMVLTIVFSVAFFFGDLPSDCLWTLAEARIFHVKHSKGAAFSLYFPTFPFTCIVFLQFKFVENRIICIEIT